MMPFPHKLKMCLVPFTTYMALLTSTILSAHNFSLALLSVRLLKMMRLRHTHTKHTTVAMHTFLNPRSAKLVCNTSSMGDRKGAID